MKEIFNLITQQGLTPNQFYLILGIKDSVSPPGLNVHMELRALKLSDWVDKENKLTAKALLLLTEVESFVKVKKKKTTQEVLGIDATEYITKYLEIFPKGMLPSGKPSRGNKTDIQNNFKWFFENYEYSWDTVLKATEYYVTEFEMNKFLYMRNSQYFICKMKPDRTRESELANYCALVESGDTNKRGHHFSEKVV